MGHDFTLWSYEPGALAGVPAGTDLRDAAEVMPRERLLHYRDSGSVALGANLWRIELLAKGLGCWVDMDFIFLRPVTAATRSEEHTSELQSLMRISYAVFCLKKNNRQKHTTPIQTTGPNTQVQY